MKSLNFVLSTLVFAGTSISFANEKGEGPKIPECQGVFAACQAAGFKPGAHQKGQKMGEGQGLWVDCIGAVADGKKQIAGVDAGAAKACMAVKKQHRQENKEHRQEKRKSNK